MTLAHCALGRAWSSEKVAASIGHRATSAAMQATPAGAAAASSLKIGLKPMNRGFCGKSRAK